MSSHGASLNPPSPPFSQSGPPSPPTHSNSNSEASSFAKPNWASSAYQPQQYLASLPTFTPVHEAGSSKSLQLGMSRPKRKRITPEQLEVLSNLFEYTDTPTFDLREAIGSKLGMSNREVQVWFQNRRAKVNRQKIPANSQVLQERPAASPQPRSRSPPSHRRMRSSPTHLLLPGVSSILHGDSRGGTFSAPPSLPLFQATLPGIDSLQDGLSYETTPDCYPSGVVAPSTQEPRSSDSFYNSSSQVRRSPPGSRRRIPICTPVPSHPRKSPQCRSPVASFEDHAHLISPRRSSSDLVAGATPESLTPCSTSNSQRNSANLHTSWPITDPLSIPHSQPSYMSLSSMKLDHSTQAKFPSNITTPPHDWAPSLHEHPTQSAEKKYSDHPLPHQSSSGTPVTDTRSSESRRFSQKLPSWQSCGGSASSPPNLPFSRQTEHDTTTIRTNDLASPAAPRALRPSLMEDTAPTTSRSLFASRYLPPLPNPVRPGPGSFPPPSALRVLPIEKDISPTTLRSPNSTSEYKLPPLLHEQNNN